MWQPPEYLVTALSVLGELDASALDTNVLRTMLMLLASLRKLPQTSPVLSSIKVALAFFIQHGNGPPEQRHALIDGGMLNTVFDMLAHMGHGHADAYIAACFTFYTLLELEEGEEFLTPIIRRVLAAAFAYGPVNEHHVPVPLWNFANGVAGYPVEIVAQGAEGGGSGFDGSAEKQARYADMVNHTMMLLMEFGLTDGSDFNSNGCGRGKAYANPQSWWHGLYRRMRPLLKNSSDSSAVDLLQFCASAVAVTADANRGSKGRFR
jgi:hypothetical protein